MKKLRPFKEFIGCLVGVPRHPSSEGQDPGVFGSKRSSLPTTPPCIKRGDFHVLELKSSQSSSTLYNRNIKQATYVIWNFLVASFFKKLKKKKPSEINLSNVLTPYV